jgi:hypothetical protein
MDIPIVERIKRIAVKAVVSDDLLMEKLVLKGGNAIDLFHHAAGRASLDLDFSMDGDFSSSELPLVESNLRKNFETVFSEEGFRVHDLTFVERPKVIVDELADFWGGYKVEFKVLQQGDYDRLGDDHEAMRRESIPHLGRKGSTKFRVEISKYEYCDHKEPKDIDGYTVFVYQPLLIVIEKLRSICQQLPDYCDIVPTFNRKPRARDFFDIYMLHSAFSIDLCSKESLSLIHSVFNAKRVPLEYILQTADHREYHRSDFDSLNDTVKQGVNLREFDFYFDYVMDLFRDLHSSGIMQPPAF